MGYFQDLQKVEWWHEPSFAYSDSVPGEFDALLIGWVGDEVLSSGKVADEILTKLEWAYEHRTLNQGCLGLHDCEICNQNSDGGEILIMDGDTSYIAPKMLLHYIKAHSYLPPQEFLDAVEKMTIPAGDG